MSNRDPHRIQSRLEDQIHLLLAEMEERPEMFTHKDRLAVITTLGMWLTRSVKLDNEPDVEAGSRIKRYAGAFKTNVARRGKSPAGPSVYEVTDDGDTAA